MLGISRFNVAKAWYLRFTVAKAWYFMQTQPLLGPWPWSQKVDLFKAYVSMVFFRETLVHETMEFIINMLSGWWYTYPSAKYEFVSWDDELPNIWKVIKFHGSSHHQPVNGLFFIRPSWACQLPTLVGNQPREIPSNFRRRSSKSQRLASNGSLPTLNLATSAVSAARSSSRASRLLIPRNFNMERMSHDEKPRI